MITLDIYEEFRSRIESRPVERAVEAALQHQSASVNADLSIVITGDEQIRELNRQFRGVDAPTDVLSFPAGYTDPESGSLYLGDMLISYPRARAQAERGGHSIADEIQLLVVHGTLHLLGHDHASPDEKAKMWTAQAEILRELGVEDLGVEKDVAQFEQLVREEIEMTRRIEALHIFNDLGGRAVDACLTRLFYQGMILNAAFLVPLGEIEGFSQRVEALKSANAEKRMEFALSGPWPPYNFIRLEDKRS